jgi:hypothetical protein
MPVDVRYIDGIAGSNPSDSKDVLSCVCCVRSGLCDGLVAR